MTTKPLKEVPTADVIRPIDVIDQTPLEELSRAELLVTMGVGDRRLDTVLEELTERKQEVGRMERCIERMTREEGIRRRDSEEALEYMTQNYERERASASGTEAARRRDEWVMIVSVGVAAGAAALYAYDWYRRQS